MAGTPYKCPQGSKAILMFRIGNTKFFRFLKEEKPEKIDNRTLRFTRASGSYCVLHNADSIVKILSGTEITLQDYFGGVFQEDEFPDVFKPSDQSSKPPEGSLFYCFWSSNLSSPSSFYTYTSQEPLINENELTVYLKDIAYISRSVYPLQVYYEEISLGSNLDLRNLGEQKTHGLSPHEP